MMESELNVTFEHYKCYKREWGNLALDGSHYTGMVGMVVYGHADLITAATTIISSRASGVTFLHPISTATYGLLLPAVDRYNTRTISITELNVFKKLFLQHREELGWKVFLLPFQNNLWALYVINSVLSAIIIWALVVFYERKRKPSFASASGQLVQWLWFTFSTSFSNAPPSEDRNRKRSDLVKAEVYIASLCGVFMWASYRAMLTSELAIRIKNMPFDSLETFLESDYQYTTHSKILL